MSLVYSSILADVIWSTYNLIITSFKIPMFVKVPGYHKVTFSIVSMAFSCEQESALKAWIWPNIFVENFSNKEVLLMGFFYQSYLHKYESILNLKLCHHHISSISIQIWNEFDRYCTKSISDIKRYCTKVLCIKFCTETWLCPYLIWNIHILIKNIFYILLTRKVKLFIW